MNPVLASIVAMLLTVPLVLSYFFFPTANYHIAIQRDAHVRDRMQDLVLSNRSNASELQASLEAMQVEGVKFKTVDVQEQGMYFLVSVDYSYDSLLSNKFMPASGKSKTVTITVDRVQ